MSRTRKLVRREKEFISAKGLVAKNWLFLAEDEVCMTLINKATGTTRRVKK